MRKIICLSFLSLLFISVHAQEINMLSKRGVPILPEKGEFGLGVDATPFLHFAGNLLNGYDLGNNLNFFTINGMYAANSIYLKYYLADRIAIRTSLRIGANSFNNRENVVANQLIPDNTVLVTDKQSTKFTNLGIGGDYLKYRGKGRLQGYFGAGAFVNYSTVIHTYSYGNEMNSMYTSPNFYDFNAGAEVSGSNRILKDYNRLNLAVDARAIVGVEFFFAPKISIGGEMGVGFRVSNENSYKESERWIGSGLDVYKVENASDGTIGLDNFTTGSLFLMFHF